MKTGKFVSKIIVLLLVFFLTTAGAAQALNISKCKGECCQNIQDTYQKHQNKEAAIMGPFPHVARLRNPTIKPRV